ncbi:hypothetical protein V5O48_000133 [Marasmius crinis-equi]|uniref:Uncharacterized protein n=1 Tax=Marasmius crinis-equi TaxID=585013 RepID=A0ABR3G228_9AGAR
MADDDSIVVDDTSPTILYSPFADTFGAPDFTAGWNPLFNRTSLGGAPLNVGNSTTVHVTSRNGSTFLINFQGTSIRLLGSAVQAQYQVFVDGVEQTTGPDSANLANIRGLPNTNHTLTLTANIPISGANQTQSFIVFDQAIVTSPAGSNSSNFTSQPLNDDAISFTGRWNFNQSNPVHQSNTVNDTARASFKGTSLQIWGTVSPAGGNYSVNLDNITTRFTARASFTQDNTLLFFSGGLDPNNVHTYELRNDGGGTLIIPVNSSMVFADGDPNPTTSATPSPTLTPVQAASKNSPSPGTIAALVLAGILGFLLITGSLFYFFVYRPRKKHREFLRRTARPTPRPSDLILDIAPEFTGRQDNEYARWKREVEGRNGSKDLGIVFRHTPSPKDKRLSVDSAVDPEELSARSFSFTPSPKNGTKGSKAGSLKSWFSGKKKGSSSSSPSYTIDLPTLQTQNLSAQSPSDSRPDLSQGSHLQQRSSFSGITSLSYLSSSSDPSRQLSFNRPEESSPNLHGRTDSHGLLLLGDSLGPHNDSIDNVSEYPATVSTQPPQVFIEEVASSYEESVQSRPSRYQLSRNTSVRTGDDRGSVRTYDDGLSVLGASTTRAAMRGLGPRTSESVSSFATFGVNTRRTDDGFAGQLDTLEESPPKHPATAQALQRDPGPSESALRPENQASYAVDYRSGSPFRVDFGQPSQSPAQPEAGPSSLAVPRGNRFSVRFDDNQRAPGPSKRDSAVGGIKPLPQPPQSSFRLTPLTPLAPAVSPVTGSSEPDSPSFLDFDVGNGSSGASQGTSSNEQAGTSRLRNSRALSSSISSRPLGARSRWSSTTPSSHQRQDSSVSSPSSPSSSFPFPVSLPASPFHPEGHKPSRPPSPGAGAASQSNLGTRAEVPLHPPDLNPISPVESVPMSISDLHFRQSDSDDVSEHDNRRRGSHLPPHPPLPSLPPTPTFPFTSTSGAGRGVAPGVPMADPSTRSSYPLSSMMPTELPSAATRHTRTHSRTLSADLMNRRPLGPRTRDSQH